MRQARRGTTLWEDITLTIVTFHFAWKTYSLPTVSEDETTTDSPYLIKYVQFLLIIVKCRSKQDGGDPTFQGKGRVYFMSHRNTDNNFIQDPYHVSMGLFWTGLRRVLVQELVYL